MTTDLQRRIEMRFDAWLDNTAEADVPADQFGDDVQADYREWLARSTEAAARRARITIEEAVLAPLAKALVRLLDWTRLGR